MTEAHDEAAFLRAFDQYADALFRHAALRLADRERARDLVQDAFIKTWDHISLGKPVYEYRSFLYRVLHNLIIDEYRRKKPLSLDALLDDETVADHVEARMAQGGLQEAEEAIDRRADAAELAVQIARLPESYRSVLTLRYLDGMSVKDIARVLDISENVAAVRIHRGVAKLKTFYA